MFIDYLDNWLFALFLDIIAVKLVNYSADSACACADGRMYNAQLACLYSL